MRFVVDLKPSDNEAAIQAMAAALDGTVTSYGGKRVIEYEAQDSPDATRKLRGAGSNIVKRVLGLW